MKYFCTYFITSLLNFKGFMRTIQKYQFFLIYEIINLYGRHIPDIK